MGGLKYFAFIIGAVLLAGCEESTEKKPRVLTDSARTAIQVDAQDHLIDMITLIRLNGADNKTFKYLVMTRDKGGDKNREIWSRVFAMQNDSFKCMVVQPVPAGAKAKFGDTVILSQGDIADWKVGDLGRGNNFGDFTGAYLKGVKQ